MTKNAKTIHETIIKYKDKWNSLPTIPYLANIFKHNPKDIKNYLTELSQYGMIRISGDKYVVNDNKPPGAVKKSENNQSETIMKTHSVPPTVTFQDSIEKPPIFKTDVKYLRKTAENNQIMKHPEESSRSVKRRIEKKYNINKSFLKNKFFYFKIIIAVCFMAFCYLGVKNNLSGFLKKTDVFHDALIYAIAFFSFSIVMATCFFIYKRNKSGKAYVFLALFFIGFTVNFSTILDGQQETFKKIFIKNEVKADKNNMELKDLIKQEKNIQSQIDNLNRELKRQEKKENDWFIRVINYDKLPPLQVKMDQLILDKKEMLKKENVSVENKDTFLDNKILQTIRFILISFSLELFASISLELLFFLKERE